MAAGNLIWTADFADPPTVTATNTMTGYKREWAKERGLPFRGWRSIDNIGDKSLLFDNGSSTSLAGIALHSINASGVRLQMSDDAVTWVGLPGYSVNHLFTPAWYQGVYRLFIPFTTQTKRAIRVVCESDNPVRTKADAGYYETAPTYFEVGTMFWIKSYTTLQVSAREPIAFDLDTGEREDALESGRVEPQRIGFPFSTFSLEAYGLNAAQLAEWRATTAGGKNRPVLWYLNSDRPEEMLWAHLIDRPRESEEFGLTSFTSQWRTVI